MKEFNNLPRTQLPGQRRRGHSQGAKSRSPHPTIASIGPVVLTLPKKNSPGAAVLEIVPADWGVSHRIVREIAEFWHAVNSQGRLRTAEAHYRSLRIAFTVLKEHGVARWPDLTVSILEEIERGHSNTLGIAFTWNCLRRLPEDSANGRVSEQVELFLQASPNVRKKKRSPTEALQPEVLRDVIRAAMSDISKAEYRIRSAKWDGVSTPPAGALIRRHETVAFYVLLCFEWGMSPDVIKDLSFDSTRPTSVQKWNDEGLSVNVRWYKHRGSKGGDLVMLADQPWRSGSLMRRLRDATAATRFAAPEGWGSFPWLCVDRLVRLGSKWDNNERRMVMPNGENLIVRSIFDGAESGFLNWCQRPRREGLSIKLSDQFTRADKPDVLLYRAIRPAAKWARFTAVGKGLLLSELVDDNTIETLSAHYLNSEVAMRDIGDSWQQVPTLAEEVARGLRPTVVNQEGEIVSGSIITEPEILRAQASNVGISGCRDPFDSPLSGEAPGRLCRSANRGCFFCPNSVVSPGDIPSLKAYLVLADRANAALSPPEWQLHWGRTVRWIEHVLPLLDPNWEDILIGDSALFDLGLQAGPA